MAETITSNDLIIFSTEDGEPWAAFVWGEHDHDSVAALITAEAVENETGYSLEEVEGFCSWPPSVKTYWLRLNSKDEETYFFLRRKRRRRAMHHRPPLLPAGSLTMAENITTPEQMREAAIDACKKVADEAKSYGIPQMTMGANTCYDAIRAIPIAPQSDPVEHWRHEVGKLHSQVERLKHIVATQGAEMERRLARAETAEAALAAAPQPVTVTVKPLVWREQSNACQVADTPWGSAAVQDESHALCPHRWGWWMVGSDEDDSATGYGHNIEQAQAAAQADYESRILSALTIHPADPLSDPRVVALVDAARGLLFAHDHGNGLEGWYNVREKLRAALRAIGGEV